MSFLFLCAFVFFLGANGALHAVEVGFSVRDGISRVTVYHELSSKSKLSQFAADAKSFAACASQCLRATLRAVQG